MTEMGNLLDGEVAAAVRLQLENHLSHCETCTVLYDSARKTVKIVTDSGSFDLPEDCLQTYSPRRSWRGFAKQELTPIATLTPSESLTRP